MNLFFYPKIMKLTKIVSVMALGAILLSSTSFAQWWRFGNEEEQESPQVERRGGDEGRRENQAGQRDGDEKREQRGDAEGRRDQQMDQRGGDEKRELRGDQEGRRDQAGQRGERDMSERMDPESIFESGRLDRPENWDEMTDEDRKAYMDANRPEKGEGMEQRREAPNAMFGREGENKPENWEEMSTEDRQEFKQERKDDRPQPGHYNKKAKKAKNYKKFKKQLREKKEFKDSHKIKNKDAVDFLQQRGILDGYEDGSFGPENPINRAESLKVLLESLGEAPDEDTSNEFEDVPEDAWFAGYVKKAKRKGIVRGYEDGTFQPARTVNQVELLKLAFESFGIDLENYDVTDLPAGAELDAWYAPYLQYALDNNLLDTDDVDPGEGMTREMFSEVMYRLIQQQESIE